MCEINTEPQSTQYTVYLDVVRKEDNPTNAPTSAANVQSKKETVYIRCILTF